MEDLPMDERKNHHHTAWDDSVYGTGPTQPPKDKGGMYAVLLILIIFLCGIITLLGILNIKLFQKIKLQEKADYAISFTAGQTEAETAPLTSAETLPPAEEAIGMELQPSPISPENTPDLAGLSLQDIYTRNISSVVSITSTTTTGTSSGTGVVLSQDGYLITNAHVVENSTSVSVQLTDNRVLNAMIMGQDEISDLALLRVEADDLVPAQFGDSSALRVGDTVVAIGDPLGVKFRGTYTNGIVSAINRDVDVNGHTMTLIQTNAALNTGNSGGPLINCYGQVVGINTMKIGTFTNSSGVEGIGFAIPSTTVKDIMDQLITQGYVSGRPTLGITGESLSIFYQHYYRLPSGLYITHVERASDSYEKGVAQGDILISLNDTKITTMNELKTILNGMEVGDNLTAVIYRGGQQYSVELTLTEDTN